MTLQAVSASGALLRFGNTGKLMEECVCCCQWAVDFTFYCLGLCDSGSWDGQGESLAAWTDFALYSVGDKREYSGTNYVCIEEHFVASGGSFDSQYWSSSSTWVQDGDPYKIEYDDCADAVAAGEVYTAGCKMTRYGTIHNGCCPATSDVSESTPTDGQSDLCGECSCLVCDEYNALPCAMSVTISGLADDCEVTDSEGTAVVDFSVLNGAYTLNENPVSGCNWQYSTSSGGWTLEVTLTNSAGNWIVFARRYKPTPGGVGERYPRVQFVTTHGEAPCGVEDTYSVDECKYTLVTGTRPYPTPTANCNAGGTACDSAACTVSIP